MCAEPLDSRRTECISCIRSLLIAGPAKRAAFDNNLRINHFRHSIALFLLVNIRIHQGTFTRYLTRSNPSAPKKPHSPPNVEPHKSIHAPPTIRQNTTLDTRPLNNHLHNSFIILLIPSLLTSILSVFLKKQTYLKSLCANITITT